MEHFIRCVERLRAIQGHGQDAIIASVKRDVLISVVGSHLASPKALLVTVAHDALHPHSLLRNAAVRGAVVWRKRPSDDAQCDVDPAVNDSRQLRLRYRLSN